MPSTLSSTNAALNSPLFANLIFEYWRLYPLPADMIIPVPLHHERERARGFNQATLIARELRTLHHVVVLEGVLTRHRATRPQVELDARERRENVRDAFLADAHVAGARILLLDDVCTTGATMDECSLALKRERAHSVWGLALARAR